MIANRVYGAAVDYETQTGQTPTRLYLGRIEFEELRDFAWREASYKIETLPGVLRSEYRGMKIYKVDAESYVAVGV